MAKDQVSEPVRTDFGFHLIKLLGVEAPEVPTFASLKDKLTRELKNPAGRAAFRRGDQAIGRLVVRSLRSGPAGTRPEADRSYLRAIRP
ncbi:peptidylprolyl isomerase [Pseudomonas lini]